MQNIELLRLLQLVSPALPVGAFAYSQAFEYAVESGEIKNDAQSFAWINGLMQQNIAQLDLPIVIRIYHALKNKNAQQVKEWNALALANRETSELRAETTQLAKALLRLLNSMQEDIGIFENTSVDWASAFALATYRWQIDLPNALLGYTWSWAENQIAAAIKLVPLGQTQGQQLLQQLADEMPAVIANAQAVEDDNIGALAPFMAIASCKHESQYSRLFRS